MKEQKSLKTVLSKCSICLENHEISSDKLINNYISFLSGTFLDEQHHTDVVLHVETTCFDAVTIACAAISCMLADDNNSEDIISQLEIGEKVEYRKKRYAYHGIKNIYGSERIELISEDGKETNWVSKQYWSLITPYHGKATTADGRGIRTKSGHRIDFYKKILQKESHEIPSLTKISVIIIMSPEKARYYAENISIKINNIDIPLLDLVTASYYTENNEICFRGNSNKNDPVIKFTNKASTARSLLFAKECNRNIGIIVLGQDNYLRNYTELPSIINRRKLLFSMISMKIDDISGSKVIEQYEDADFYICSKEYLSSVYEYSSKYNVFTSKLLVSVDNIINHVLIKENVTSGFSESDYYLFKKIMAQICRQVEGVRDENTSLFIKQAYSLMKLFITAPFSMSEFEMIRETLKINISSPIERISRLNELSHHVNPIVDEKIKQIIKIITNAYGAFLYSTDKKEKLIDLIMHNNNKKIAVIVPYEYFGLVIHNIDIPGVLGSKTRKLMSSVANVDISTPAKFNRHKYYDVIIVTSLLQETVYDLFRNYSASETYVILYPFENRTYNAKKRAAEQFDRKLNRLISLDHELDEVSAEDNDITKQEIEAEQTIDEFISRINNMILFKDYIYGNKHNSSLGKSIETVRSASFEDDEIAFFTKNYKAYVLDSVNEEVIEKTVNELESGDTLIFTRSNENTRDIVDAILQKMISNEKVSFDIKLSYERSIKWKKDLKKYKEDNHCTTTDIINRLIKMDVGVSSRMAIRNWMDPDSHVVRPRARESLIAIAKLTGDMDLEKEVDMYINACDEISSIRRSIQKEIGKAIIGRITGKTIDNNPFIDEINERLDNAAQILRIETIVDNSQDVPINYINRPFFQ